MKFHKAKVNLKECLMCDGFNYNCKVYQGVVKYLGDVSCTWYNTINLDLDILIDEKGRLKDDSKITFQELKHILRIEPVVLGLVFEGYT